jgi:hypothetical protein
MHSKIISEWFPFEIIYILIMEFKYIPKEILEL